MSTGQSVSSQPGLPSDTFNGTRLDRPTNRRVADPQAIIEAIQRVREGDLERAAHTDTLPAMDLPGFGTQLDDCGDDLPHFCRSCGATFTIGRTCNRSQCPRCAVSWARQRASSICGKLDACRRYLYASGNDNQFYHHLVISPPPDWSVDAGEDHQAVFERTLDVVKDTLDELGVEGVVFYHPYRGVDGDDRGAWKQRIGHYRPWTEHQRRNRDDLQGEPVRDELELSPHFHIVGIAPFVDGDGVSDVVEAATGWVIHRITQSENSTKSITDDFSLARAVSYAISHVGLYESQSGNVQAAYRYVGSTLNDVTAYEDNQARIDAIVRAVAPRTLGIPLRELACSTEVVDRAEYRVDLGRAIGKTKVGQTPSTSTELPRTSNVDATGEVIVGSSGPGEADDAELLQESDGTTVTRDNPDLAACQGALLPIHKAGDYLHDDEWVAQAENAKQLLETWNEWISKPAQRDFLERWLDDHPPPPYG